MNNQSTTPQNSFSAFSSAAAEAQASDTAKARHQATSDERTVLALQMIADQLVLIHADLSSIDDFARGQDFAQDAGAPGLAEADTTSWDNEGGSPAQEVFEYPDVVRSVEERFAVGGYSYTNLQHAIAEAKRVRLASLDNGRSN